MNTVNNAQKNERRRVVHDRVGGILISFRKRSSSSTTLTDERLRNEIKARVPHLVKLLRREPSRALLSIRLRRSYEAAVCFSPSTHSQPRSRL